MFKTGHDEANRAAVRAVAAGDLPLVGLAVYGPRNAVDKVMKGAAAAHVTRDNSHDTPPVAMK